MTDEQDPRREQYQRARRAFEDLGLEERALFLLQETFATIGHSIAEVGRLLADELSALFQEQPRPEGATAGAASSPLDPDVPRPSGRARRTPPRATPPPPPPPDEDIGVI